MGLESATYIQQLVATYPLSSDPRSQGDDHLRLIKSVLKYTFPNLDAAVNATPDEMNALVGMTGTILDALAAKAELNDLANYAALDQAQRFSKAQGYVPNDLGPVSGAITVNLADSNVIKLTVSAEITSIAFSNAIEGKPYFLYVSNPTGLPVALGTNWRAAGGADPGLSVSGSHILQGLYLNSSMIVIAASTALGTP